MFYRYTFIKYVEPCLAQQNQIVFFALPRHESLSDLGIAIVKLLLKMLDKINALVRHFI